MYTPNLGRWMTVDPMGPAMGDNQYNAYNNNPLLLMDPSGLSSTTVDGADLINNWLLDIQMNNKIAQNKDESVGDYFKRISKGVFNAPEQLLLYGLLYTIREKNKLKVELSATCSCKDMKWTMKDDAKITVTGQTKGTLTVPSGISFSGFKGTEVYDYNVEFAASGVDYNHDADPPTVCADITMKVKAKIGIYSFEDSFKAGRICTKCGETANGKADKDKKGEFWPVQSQPPQTNKK